MRVSQIAAMARNRVIGRENRLPWSIPEDLKRFRALTSGHAVIMGRKTFQSLGRPLPNRENLIISRDPGFAAQGGIVFSSPGLAIAYCREKGEKEAFVIGGAEIYAQTLGVTDRIYLTLVDADYDGDAFYPEIPEGEFVEASCEKRLEPVPFRFLVLDRVSG